MTSPCGKIRIPITEEGKREGRADPGVLGQVPRRRHPAHRAWVRPTCRSHRGCACAQAGIKLLDTIDTYYELVDKRIPGHGENVAELKRRKILHRWQGGRAAATDLFSENQLGPIFFEFIQRKGRPGLRRRQLQGPVREHRARPDAARRAQPRPELRRRMRLSLTRLQHLGPRRSGASTSAMCGMPPMACSSICARTRQRAAAEAGMTMLSQWP